MMVMEFAVDLVQGKSVNQPESNSHWNSPLPLCEAPTWVMPRHSSHYYERNYSN